MFGMETTFAVIRLRFAFSTIIRRICERENCIFIVPLNCQISISGHQIKHRFEINYCRYQSMPSRKREIQTIQQTKPIFSNLPF